MPEPTRAILCVEDDPDILQLLCHLLRTFVCAESYTVLAATSGAAALALLATHQVPLVITDYVMPAMNGLTLHTAVKRCSPATRVLLVTGYIAEPVAALAQAQAVDGYLTKPFVVSTLKATVVTLLDDAAAAETRLCDPSS